jgi:hypothetical protein
MVTWSISCRCPKIFRLGSSLMLSFNEFKFVHSYVSVGTSVALYNFSGIFLLPVLNASQCPTYVLKLLQLIMYVIAYCIRILFICGELVAKFICLFSEFVVSMHFYSNVSTSFKCHDFGLSSGNFNVNLRFLQIIFNTQNARWRRSAVLAIIIRLNNGEKWETIPVLACCKA